MGTLTVGNPEGTSTPGSSAGEWIGVVFSTGGLWLFDDSTGASAREIAGCFFESGFRVILKGRTGADDNDPIAVAGLAVLKDGLVFGDKIAESADPGRSGKRLSGKLARFFCAAIVSLMEGLAAGTEVVLRDNAGALAATMGVSATNAFCGFGLDESSIRRSCCFFSREARILAM